jgi:hypothetical protein
MPVNRETKAGRLPPLQRSPDVKDRYLFLDACANNCHETLCQRGLYILGLFKAEGFCCICVRVYLVYAAQSDGMVHMRSK